MGRQTLALLAALDTACANVADVDQEAAEAFQQHPDCMKPGMVHKRVG
jgi:hypothetical protein